MNSEEQRLIGGVLARLEIIEDRQDEIRKENRADHAKLFDELATIASEGCAKGKRQDDDIKELKTRPERLVGIGAAIVAAIGAVVAWSK